MGKKGQGKSGGTVPDMARVLEPPKEKKDIVLEHRLEPDHHENLRGMLREAVSVQMQDFDDAELDYMRPNFVGAGLMANYVLMVRTDQSKIGSEIQPKVTIKRQGKEVEVMVPTKVGLYTVAEAHGDKVISKTSEIKPPSTGVVKEGQIQDALPTLVKKTIDEAVDKGQQEEKRLRSAPKSEIRQDFYIDEPNNQEAYMDVMIDPMEMTKDLPKLFAAAARIKKIVGDVVSTKLKDCNVEFHAQQNFNTFYGRNHKGEEIDASTKEARVSLSVSAEMTNGVQAWYFTGGTGGLEAIKHATYDWKTGKRKIVTDFEESIDLIARDVADRLFDKDTDETIRTLGSKAPVILSQQAAANLIYAVTVYASGTLIKEEIDRDKKELKGNLGSKLFPKNVNILVGGGQHEDPGEEHNRYGAKSIDVEGTPVKRFQLVENGTLIDMLKTRESFLPVAEGTESIVHRETDYENKTLAWKVKEGKGLNGCARKQDYTAEIVAAPTLIDLEEDPNGKTKMRDISKAIGTQRAGLYVENVIGVTCDTEGEINLILDLGYIIQNGEVNKQKRINRGKITIKLEDLRTDIVGISGKGTAIPYAINGQFGKQTLPLSVSAPIIVLDKATLVGGTSTKPYVEDLMERGTEAYYDHIARLRNRNLPPDKGEARVFTAISAIPKSTVSIPGRTDYMSDLGTVIEDPDFQTERDGKLTKY